MNTTYLAQGMKFQTPHGTVYVRLCNCDRDGVSETRASFDDILIAKTDKFLVGREGYIDLDDAIANGVEWYSRDEKL